MMETVEFQPFAKIARLSRECIITEKIDGTNAQVCVDLLGVVRAGSRTRWLTPENDNYGFAAWVKKHEDELRQLGPGRHFGEWWGQGIQRRYGMQEKVFSLFNVTRFGPIPPVSCCRVVPLLYRGPFTTEAIEHTLADLKRCGSEAAPGYMNPEGIVVFHTASGTLFKKTIEGDEQPKSLAA